MQSKFLFLILEARCEVDRRRNMILGVQMETTVLLSFWVFTDTTCRSSEGNKMETVPFFYCVVRHHIMRHAPCVDDAGFHTLCFSVHPDTSMIQAGDPGWKIKVQPSSLYPLQKNAWNHIPSHWRLFKPKTIWFRFQEAYPGKQNSSLFCPPPFARPNLKPWCISSRLQAAYLWNQGFKISKKSFSTWPSPCSFDCVSKWCIQGNQPICAFQNGCHGAGQLPPGC